MNLRSIPAGVPFLPALASAWRTVCTTHGCAPHDGLILLPTRRAARGLATAFLENAGGRAMLLPRIVALGALDEAPLALAGALSLPPAIAEPQRRAMLAQLILRAGSKAGAPSHAATAWILAGDLATLMDEAERAEIDLEQGLLKAADAVHAVHWDQTLTFLRIVTHHWPDCLAEEGLMNPVARQIRLIDAQIAAWEACAPAAPVLAVGAAGDIPAVGRLLRAIARLPRGLVVLPGLDHELSDLAWKALDEAHPQAGLARLLSGLDARRGDVVPHEFAGGAQQDAQAGRRALLRRALLPADALDDWQEEFTPALDGITRLAAADVQEEAVAIALLLRDALQTPGARAALITPDRNLAERVAAELMRWGVVADDSAGEQLAQTPPAVFLRLIAAALEQQMAPVSLLALLKHPLAASGLPTALCRDLARALERQCLRGPAPLPGLAGLRRAVDQARPEHCRPEQDPLADLLARLEHCLAPALRITAAASCQPAELMSALIAAAESLAATDASTGPARLWAGEDGEALAALLAEIQEALPALPLDTPACLAGLLDAVLAGTVVRSRRATRGRTGQGLAEHPRLFIWGLLEARLQDADLLILGGLTEGVWPPATDPGPWMSRPMRVRAGLASTEGRVGQAAHDFWMAACAAPRVVLSAPRRRDGAPTVPSRWLTRLEALLSRRGGLPLDSAAAWARQLDAPAGRAAPVQPPRPCPPVASRPRRLSVTDVGTLLRDPYEIYARRILDLRELEPLQQSAESRDYGIIVHQGLHRLLETLGTTWPDDAEPRLLAALNAALHSAAVRPALLAWWSPRLAKIAAWVDGEERRRRAASPLAALLTEHKGEWVLPRAAGDFTLVGRADRIERRCDGSIAILDYKTGSLPSERAVAYGLAPQLLLEGAMVRAGAFGADLRGSVQELTYWRLSGDHKAGEAKRLCAKSPDGTAILIGEAADRLADLLEAYEQPMTVYPAQPAAPREAHRAYAHLARAAEWGAAQDENDSDAAE